MLGVDNTLKLSYVAYPRCVDPLSTGGAWVKIEVPPGFYSMVDLAAALEGLFLLRLANITPLKVDIFSRGQMQLFRIWHNAAAPAVPLSISVASPLTAEAEVAFDYRDLLYLMGYTTADQNKLGFVSGCYSSVNPSLQGEQAVYLHSQQLCGQLRSFSGEGAPDFFVAAIPITVPYGGTQIATQLTATPNFPMVVFPSGWTPSVVDFQLRNIYNDVLDLPDNAQFWAVVRLWYY